MITNVIMFKYSAVYMAYREIMCRVGNVHRNYTCTVILPCPQLVRSTSPYDVFRGWVCGGRYLVRPYRRHTYDAVRYLQRHTYCLCPARSLIPQRSRSVVDCWLVVDIRSLIRCRWLVVAASSLLKLEVGFSGVFFQSRPVVYRTMEETCVSNLETGQNVESKYRLISILMTESNSSIRMIISNRTNRKKSVEIL